MAWVERTTEEGCNSRSGKKEGPQRYAFPVDWVGYDPLYCRYLRYCISHPEPHFLSYSYSTPAVRVSAATQRDVHLLTSL